MSNVTSCRHCEKEVEIESKICPQCGFNNPGKVQGKLLYLAMLGIVISIAALKGELLIAGIKILAALKSAFRYVAG